MKKILVLTNFSSNAEHAAQSAMNLADQLHTDILLFNAYQSIPVTNYYSGGVPWTGEGTSYWKDQSEKRMADFKKQLTDNFPPQGFLPDISTLCREGNLGTLVAEIEKEMDIELIVMGSRSGNSFERIFFGSDTNAVIEHASHPILVLREDMTFSRLRKAVLATNFDKEDLNGLRYLAKLGRKFHAEIQVVHIIPVEGAATKSKKEENFMELAAGLKYPRILSKDIRGEDVIQRLNRFCREDQTDLLAVIHHPHSFFIRMVRQSTTSKAVEEHKVPLLIFPVKFAEIPVEL